MTLRGLADWMVREGALYAVNMDGGSSSTLVKKGNGGGTVVLNAPTCLDLPVRCERPVASVMCLV